MSILIKGMEMPTRCEDCCMMTMVMGGTAYTGYWCKATYKKREIDCGTRPSWCPLVELPPHGRLIDADALRLLYDFNGYEPTGDMTEEEFDRLMCRLPVIRQNIDDMPTIIEAEQKT